PNTQHRPRRAGAGGAAYSADSGRQLAESEPREPNNLSSEPEMMLSLQNGPSPSTGTAVPVRCWLPVIRSVSGEPSPKYSITKWLSVGSEPSTAVIVKVAVPSSSVTGSDTSNLSGPSPVAHRLVCIELPNQGSSAALIETSS